MTILDLDQRLLELLAADARQSTAALARKLAVSRSTVVARIQRLLDRGVIRGFTVRLGAGEHSGVRAHVMIKLDARRARRAELRLSAIAGVTALYSISGEYDLIAEASTGTTQEMDKLLDDIRQTEGVRSTQSSIILSTRMSR